MPPIRPPTALPRVAAWAPPESVSWNAVPFVR